MRYKCMTTCEMLTLGVLIPIESNNRDTMSCKCIFLFVFGIVSNCYVTLCLRTQCIETCLFICWLHVSHTISFSLLQIWSRKRQSIFDDTFRAAFHHTAHTNCTMHNTLPMCAIDCIVLSPACLHSMRGSDTIDRRRSCDAANEREVDDRSIE